MANNKTMHFCNPEVIQRPHLPEARRSRHWLAVGLMGDSPKRFHLVVLPVIPGGFGNSEPKTVGSVRSRHDSRKQVIPRLNTETVYFKNIFEPGNFAYLLTCICSNSRFFCGIPGWFGPYWPIGSRWVQTGSPSFQLCLNERLHPRWYPLHLGRSGALPTRPGT